MEKLQKIYGYVGLKTKRDLHRGFEKKQPKPSISLVDPNALIGIEVEVENIHEQVALQYYWKKTEDGSLRNNGAEFVSIPLRCSQAEFALNYLNQQVKMNNEPIFSPRTSVHIHLNVRDLTWDQVKVIVLLYAIFEKHFFHFSGKSREESIFCVPLYKTEQLQWIDSLEGQPKWHKYNALNLAPIYGDEDVNKYGTVEFRHLYGTLDTPTILNWINNICCLRVAAKELKLDELKQKILDMNTTSEYIALYQSVFGQYADLRKMTKFDFENCVSLTKKSLFGSQLNEQYTIKKGSAWFGDDETNKKVKTTLQPVVPKLNDIAKMYTHYVGKTGTTNLVPMEWLVDGVVDSKVEF